jgi:TPR repeat protein
MATIGVMLVAIGVAFPAVASRESSDQLDAVYREALSVYDEGNQSGDIRSEHFQTAYVMWRHLSRKGHVASKYYLGILHTYGMGGATFDPPRGFQLIKESADGGYHVAQTLVAVQLEKGEGKLIGLDPTEALAYYRRAAEGGHCAAVKRMARAAEKGELGMVPDVAAGKSWLERLDDCVRR